MFNSKEYQRDYYLTHKEKYVPNPENKRRNDKKYQEKNRDKILIARSKWRIDNYEKDLYIQTRKRSNRNHIPFDLDINDIIIPECCPYLKFGLTRIAGQGRVWTNPSIDRIDPHKGYTKGNIEIISMLANSMKNQATREQLITFATSILDKFNNDNSG